MFKNKEFFTAKTCTKKKLKVCKFIKILTAGSNGAVLMLFRLKGAGCNNRVPTSHTQFSAM